MISLLLFLHCHGTWYEGSDIFLNGMKFAFGPYIQRAVKNIWNEVEGELEIMRGFLRD